MQEKNMGHICPIGRAGVKVLVQRYCWLSHNMESTSKCANCFLMKYINILFLCLITQTVDINHMHMFHLKCMAICHISFMLNNKLSVYVKSFTCVAR